VSPHSRIARVGWTSVPLVSSFSSSCKQLLHWYQDSLLLSTSYWKAAFFTLIHSKFFFLLVFSVVRRPHERCLYSFMASYFRKFFVLSHLFYEDVRDISPPFSRILLVSPLFTQVSNVFQRVCCNCLVSTWPFFFRFLLSKAYIFVVFSRTHCINVRPSGYASVMSIYLTAAIRCHLSFNLTDWRTDSHIGRVEAGKMVRPVPELCIWWAISQSCLGLLRSLGPL